MKRKLLSVFLTIIFVLQSVSVFASGSTISEYFGILNYIDEFAIVEQSSERVIMTARHDNAFVTLTYDMNTNFLTLASEVLHPVDVNSRVTGIADTYETGFYLQLSNNNGISVLNTLSYRGVNYDLSTMIVDGDVVTGRIAITLTALLGAALINALIATVLTLTIGAMILVIATSITQDLTRQRESNHFVAVLSGGQLFIGDGITLATAQARLRSHADVWSLTSALARTAAGGMSAIGPETHYMNGSRNNRYFDHWHLANRAGGHSFFGHGRAGLR